MVTYSRRKRMNNKKWFSRKKYTQVGGQDFIDGFNYLALVEDAHVLTNQREAYEHLISTSRGQREIMRQLMLDAARGRHHLGGSKRVKTRKRRRYLN